MRISYTIVCYCNICRLDLHTISILCYIYSRAAPSACVKQHRGLVSCYSLLLPLSDIHIHQFVGSVLIIAHKDPSFT